MCALQVDVFDWRWAVFGNVTKDRTTSEVTIRRHALWVFASTNKVVGLGEGYCRIPTLKKFMFVDKRLDEQATWVLRDWRDYVW